MYKKVVMTVLLAVLVFAGRSGMAMGDKETDALISKIETALDPEGVMSKVKTKATKSEVIIPAQKIKINSIVMDKFPYKSKSLTEIPGLMMSVRVYNGKVGWEFSPASGMREIKGKELAAMKFEMDMKNPTKKMRDVFTKIEVADDFEKVGEFECYKLICTPKEEYESKPVTLYFDKDKLFLRRMDMVLESQMGPMKMESILSDYKKIDKVWVAMEATLKQMGMVMKVKVLEIKNNVDIPDSEFEKPSDDMSGSTEAAK